jgi:uncharacterized membrane protein
VTESFSPKVAAVTAASGAASGERGVDTRPAALFAHAAPLSPAPRPSSKTGPSIDWSRATLATALLALTSISVTLAVWLCARDVAELDLFIRANQVAAPARHALFLWVVLAAALPLPLAAALLVRGRAAGVTRLCSLADRLGPLVLAFAIPSLVDYRIWYDQPLTYLSMLLPFVLLLERLLGRCLSTWPLAKSPVEDPQAIGGVACGSRYAVEVFAPLCFVVLAASAYTAYTAYFSIMAHHRLVTAGFDLGIFDNLMWNAWHGKPFHSTVATPNGSYLSNHAEYGMYLFLPFYALWPGPETLLWMQSLMMGFAALPLYLFAATRLSRPVAAAIACAYLLYAPLHGPNFFDFHWMPLAMFFDFWLFYAIAVRKRWLIVLNVLIICSMREDAALGLATLGVFLIVTGHWPSFGAGLTIVSVAWFVLVKFVIMPWAGPWWFANIYKELIAPGEDGYGSIVRTILVNPNFFARTLLTQAKLTYTLQLLAPLALLPVRRPALALLMFPGFFVTLMTTGYEPTTSISFQYTTHWIPWLFGAIVLALQLHDQQRGRAAMFATLGAICVGVLCHSYTFGALLQRHTFTGGFTRVSFEISEPEQKRYADLLAVAAHLPPKASVAATEQEVPHVSTRADAFTLKTTHGDAQYLFVFRPHVYGDAQERLRDAFQRHRYGVVFSQGDFYLFKRDFESDQTRAAVLRLGVAPKPRPAPKP